MRLLVVCTFAARTRTHTHEYTRVCSLTHTHANTHAHTHAHMPQILNAHTYTAKGTGDAADEVAGCGYVASLVQRSAALHPKGQAATICVETDRMFVPLSLESVEIISKT